MANTTAQASLEEAVHRADVSRLCGTWYGIKLDENPIAQLLITDEDGILMIHPYGSPESDLPDWGPTGATAFVDSGSTTATGFQARWQRDTTRVEFFVVENQGVLLAQTFTSFHDDSGRPGRFAKAYYRRSPGEIVATAGISTGTVTGEWVNSNPASIWVAGFTIIEGDGAPTISIRGVSDPIDWGQAALTVCQDKHDEANLCAEFDLEPFRASIGVISVKNLVVLNQFRRFKNDELIPSFCREFFFRNR